jgi:threonine dehydrogenase-like Zn-dependent dehydrogenase
VQRDGALTEYLTAPWQRLFGSDRLSLEQLALVEPLTVGAHAVDRGRVSEDDTVCVLGCGAIGLGAVAAAARSKARVIGVDIDDAKLELAAAAGASALVHSARDPLHEKLLGLTAGNGPDVVIEAIGLPATFRAAVEEVCFGGRVVYIGYAKEPVQYETKLFVQKELDILGSRNATDRDFRQVIAMLEAAAFPADATVTRVVSLDRAADALAAWDADPAAVTRILVAV